VEKSLSYLEVGREEVKLIRKPDSSERGRKELKEASLKGGKEKQTHCANIGCGRKKR